MKYIFYSIVLFFTCFPFFNFGQYNAPVQDLHGHGFQNSIIGNGGFLTQSTKLHGDIQRRLFFGGEINTRMIANSEGTLDARNRFGFHSNNEISYFNGKGKIFKNDSITWMAQAGYSMIGGLNYASSFYHLLFRGNETIPNDTLDLSNSGFSAFQFQKIGFGLGFKKSRSFIALNYVNIENVFRAGVDKGFWVQSSDNSSISIDVNGSANFISSKKFNKGVGVCLDADIYFKTPWVKETSTYFKLGIRNLGFAYLKDVITYKIDKTIDYSGFSINQLISNQGVFGEDFSILDSLGIIRDTVNQTLALPSFLEVSRAIDYDCEGIPQSFFGLRMYPTLDAVPELFAGIFYRTKKKISGHLNIAYGGFGNFRSGIGMNYHGEKAHFSVASDDLLGSISPLGSGISFYFKYSILL